MRFVRRKCVLGLLLTLTGLTLIHLWHSSHKNNGTSRNDTKLMDQLLEAPPAGNMTNSPNDLQMTSVINLPKWYTNKDWGLREDIYLENLTVKDAGDDKEEETAWNNFFFGSTKGLMLELGAMAGKSYSVSRFFEKEAKWRTILIEGNPRMASKLSMNRPNSLNFNLVICDRPSTVHFFTINNDLDGMDGIIEFMSSEFLKYFPFLLGIDGKVDMKKVAKNKFVKKVQCLPLADVLLPLNITHINFFLLDVEGGELSVLKSIDFDQITFDVIAVETDRVLDTPEITIKYVDAVIEFLTSKGYKVWTRKIGRNSWFISPTFQPFSKNT